MGVEEYLRSLSLPEPTGLSNAAALGPVHLGDYNLPSSPRTRQSAVLGWIRAMIAQER